MVHTDYIWLASGRRQVYAQSWLPDNPPKGMICLVHGLGEHSGRYARWAELFVKAGYGMLALDLPGHGRTEGRKAFVRRYDDLLDCVDLLLEKSSDLIPGVPRILYGHSMGGNIAINYAISREANCEALIASSPWLRLTFRVSPMALAFGKFMNGFFPRVRFKRKGTNAERLSHDPDHWSDVRADPLNHKMVTGRYFWIIHKQGEYAMKNADKIHLPFLLMHGGADQVTSPEASEELAAGCSGKVLYKRWDGLYHELHWEFEYKEVAIFVIDWLENR